MDDKRKIYGEDDDMENVYDDPSLDALIIQLCRSDDAEYVKKEISRKTKKLKK